MIMAALAAMLVVSAIPVAFAQDRNDRQEDRFEDNGFFFFFFGDGDRFDGDRFDDGVDFENGSGISQEVEQDAESGDVSQSFNVSSTYGWDGGYDTLWYVDPKEELVGSR